MNLTGGSLQLCWTQVLHYAVHFAFTLLEILSSYRHIESGLLFCDFGHMFAVCVQTRICAQINKQSVLLYQNLIYCNTLMLALGPTCILSHYQVIQDSAKIYYASVDGQHFINIRLNHTSYLSLNFRIVIDFA